MTENGAPTAETKRDQALELAIRTMGDGRIPVIRADPKTLMREFLVKKLNRMGFHVVCVDLSVIRDKAKLEPSLTKPRDLCEKHGNAPICVILWNLQSCRPQTLYDAAMLAEARQGFLCAYVTNERDNRFMDSDAYRVIDGP